MERIERKSSTSAMKARKQENAKTVQIIDVSSTIDNLAAHVKTCEVYGSI